MRRAGTLPISLTACDSPVSPFRPCQLLLPVRLQAFERVREVQCPTLVTLASQTLPSSGRLVQGVTAMCHGRQEDLFRAQWPYATWSSARLRCPTCSCSSS
ncbi:hypothetical protein BU25DRAFT_129602 [Macroventuria anomochaeta]|uniref:Uncharacterized protein n=1 Tax=Macroventuria anomochaeta TaxID=301207 RepID=A0ACB6RSK6_9PLEO|nr:uncharacterized protein BU25DRAFT_129602 [Macroventuria anomochaeta]KAF2624965.1 hypothetical protein BU25DRAFT_129602 [Macroventuria anomochaeta]